MKKSMITGIIVSLFALSAFAVPNSITVQGRLLQNGVLVNGDQTMSFQICASASDCSSPLWSTPDQTVAVNQGIYSVELTGISPNALATANAYLETTVGTETLSPLTKLTSVAYASLAGGLYGGSGSQPNVFVSSNGNVGIGTTSPAEPLQVSGNISVGTSTGTKGFGVEMYSPDGTLYCLTIANGGTTAVGAGACP